MDALGAAPQQKQGRPSVEARAPCKTGSFASRCRRTSLVHLDALNDLTLTFGIENLTELAVQISMRLLDSSHRRAPAIGILWKPC